MQQFQKGRRSLYLFIAGLVLTIAVLVTWLVLTLKSPAVEVGDVLLLSFLFVVLLGGEIAMLALYFRRPNILLEADQTSVFIHLSRKKVINIAVSDLSTITLNRSILYLVTKESKLYTVRFLRDPREAQAFLKARLHDFINNNPDAYFNIPPKDLS